MTPAPARVVTTGHSVTSISFFLSSPWWSPAPPHIKWLSHTKIGIDVGSASAPGWFDDETELTTTAATRWGSCASTSFAVGGGSAHEIVWITSQADWLSEVGNANALASTQFVARDETGHVTGTETLVNVAFFGDADWGDELFGLDPDEVSFSGVMTHELGHVVGFSWPSHPDTVCEGCTVMIGVIQAGDHQTFEKLGRLDTESDRYYPGDFFNETCSNPFNMGQITSNILALVIGATCSTADWVWTEDPDFDKPPCEDFLTDWDAGAIAWIGPSKGSYGQASFRVTLYTVEEIFQNQQRPMAESWLIAMQRLYANFPNHLRFHNTFNEYVFLGDPLSPMLRPDAVTAADGSYVPSDVTLQCTPNPFNPRTRIDFSIVNRGLVSLRIYDVKGVMIRELVSKNMDPGEYFVEWGGDDGRGNAAGSGVYFCRLTSSGRSVVRKIVLLK